MLPGEFETVPATGLTLGMGYDLVRNVPRLYSALDAPPTPDANGGPPDVGFSATISGTEEQRFSLDSIDVAAKARALIYNGTIKTTAKWLGESTQKALSAEVRIILREPPPTLQAVYLSTKAAELMARGDLKAFTNYYGTHAVVGFQREASLAISFSTKAVQQKELLDIVASLSASASSVSFGANLAATYHHVASELLKTADGRLSLSARGVLLNQLNLSEPPSDPDAFFAWSQKALNALLGIERQPRPTVAVLAPYSIMQIKNSASMPSSEAAVPTSEILRLYYSLMTWRPRLMVLRGISEDREQFDFMTDEDKNMLAPHLGRVREFVGSLLAAAEQMQTDPAAKVPEIPEDIGELIDTLPWPDPRITVTNHGFADNEHKFHSVELAITGGNATAIRGRPLENGYVYEYPAWEGRYNGSVRYIKNTDNDTWKKVDMIVYSASRYETTLRLTYHFNNGRAPEGPILLEWVHPNYGKDRSRGEKTVFAATVFTAR